MKKHNLILVAFFSLTMATGCYNGHILDKPITMLANDKKTALTPPTSFEYSVKLHSVSPVEWGPVWSYYDNSGVITPGYDRFLLSTAGMPANVYRSQQAMLVPIWSTTPANNSIGLDFRFSNPTPIVAYSSVYQIQYGVVSVSGSPTPTFQVVITNPTPHGVHMYLDISSSGSNKGFSYYLNGVYGNDVYGYYASMNKYYIPPFETSNFRLVSSTLSIDAIYFDILPLSSGMIGFASENYDSGFGGGFDEGWRSVDNLQWLENVATAVKDIFSVEILPGFTVGFIVLFPLVVAIVKWFLSLFGIGGGS